MKDKIKNKVDKSIDLNVYAELTDIQKRILDERLLDKNSEYITAEESIKLLKSTYK